MLYIPYDILNKVPTLGKYVFTRDRHTACCTTSYKRQTHSMLYNVIQETDTQHVVQRHTRDRHTACCTTSYRKH